MAKGPEGKGKVGKWLRRVILALLAFLVISLVVALLAAILFVHFIDSPAVRQRLTRIIEEKTGIIVSYDSLSLSVWDGLSLEGLTVENPEPFHKFAPAFINIGTIEAHWNLGDLLWSGLRLRKLSISGVQVTIVEDQKGRNSLLAIVEQLSGPKETEEAKPLSAGIPIKGLGITADEASIEDIKITRLFVEGEQVVRLQTLEGLELRASLHAASEPETFTLSLQTPEGKETRIGMEELAPLQQKSSLAFALFAKATALDPLHADASISVSHIKTDLVPFSLPEKLLDLKASITFSPEESKTLLKIDKGAVSLATMAAEVEVYDPKPNPANKAGLYLREARLELPYDTIPKELVQAFGLPQCEACGLEISTKDLALLPALPFVELHGSISASLVAKRTLARLGERELEGRDLKLTLEGRQREDGGFTLLGRLNGGRLFMRDGALQGRTKSLEALVEATLPNLETLLDGTSEGNLKISLQAQRLNIRTPPSRLRLQGPKLQIDAAIKGPKDLSELSIEGKGRLEWAPSSYSTLETKEVPISSGKVEFEAKGLTYRPSQKPTGEVRGKIQFGEVEAEVTASLTPDLLAHSLRVEAPSLAFLEPLLSPSLRRFDVPLKAISLRLFASGKVRKKEGGLRVAEEFEAETKGLSATIKGRRWQIGRLYSKGQVEGEKDAPKVALEVMVEGAGRPSLNLNLKATADIEKKKPSGKAQIEVRHGQHKVLEVDLATSFGRRDGALHFEGHLGLLDLAPLTPFLQGAKLDFARLSGSGSIKARVFGLLSKGQIPRLNPKWLQEAEGEVTLDFALKGLFYSDEPFEVEMPKAEGSLNIVASSAHLQAQAKLSYPSLRVDQRVRHLAISEGSHFLALKIPRLGGESSLSLKTTFAEVDHNLKEIFPIGQVNLEVQARALGLESVRFDSFLFENKASGTRLEADGAIDGLSDAGSRTLASLWDLLIGHKSLLISGRLVQDLSFIAPSSLGLDASGSVLIPFTIQSGDRNLFRVYAGVEARDVTLKWPQKGLSITGLRGYFPLVEEVQRRPDGTLSLVTDLNLNIFSKVRFSDLHPFLKSSGYIWADSVKVGRLKLSPIGGNLRIAGNVFSMDQIEAEFGPGRFSGQAIVRLSPKDFSASLRGKLTGLLSSSSDEVLDGNAALEISLKEREVRGRVHLNRLGRGHLLDLLDLFDPYHENVSANRIRTALKYGYPKYGRVRLDGGFMSAKVELGGLGSLVRIDEVRGIPTGPLLSRILGSIAAYGEGGER